MGWSPRRSRWAKRKRVPQRDKRRKEHRNETVFAPRNCPLGTFATYMTTKASQLKENLGVVGGRRRSRRGRPEAPCSSPSPRKLRPRPAAGSTALTSLPPPCCARWAPRWGCAPTPWSSRCRVTSRRHCGPPHRQAGSDTRSPSVPKSG